MLTISNLSKLVTFLENQLIIYW